MRKLSKIALLLLTLSLLASCSASPELLSFMPEVEDTGFGGREFILRTSWVEGWAPGSDEADVEYDATALTLFEDSLLAHNAKVMEEHDCKIVVKLDNNTRAENMAVEILSNSIDYDLMDMNLSYLVNSIKGGFVHPWEHAMLDLTDTEKYGPARYLDTAEYNGYHYGIWPHYWRSGIEYRGIVGVNNNILKDFTDVSVHELYENGKWTFDEFKKLLTLCLEDDSIYPLSYYDEKLFSLCGVIANGGNLVEYDEATDRYSYGLLDPKAVTGLEYVKSIIDEGLAVPEYDWSAIFNTEQRAAFTISETWCMGGTVLDMDMICFPFGPDAEYGKEFGAFRSTNSRYVYMPIAADATQVGRFVDIWFEEIENYPKSTLLEDFKMNEFFNEESFNMWITLAENATYDYAFILNDYYETFCTAMNKAVFNNGSISSFIDSFKGTFTEVIDEELN